MDINTALERFIELNAQSKYALLTREIYESSVCEFIKIIGLKNTDEIDLLSIKKYHNYFINKLAAATLHKKTMAIKAFIKYLEKEEIIKTQFSNEIFIPLNPEMNPRPLSELEYQKLFEVMKGETRDKAMFEILLQTGIRLSELTYLTLADVNLPQNPSKDAGTGFGTVRIKRGSKMQELILNYKACITLEKYLKTRISIKDTNALFLTKFNTPMTNRSAQKAFTKYAKNAGLEWAHIHTLRTTHITHHLAKKTPLQIVQRNAGHKYTTTTARFTHLIKKIDAGYMQDNAL